MSNPQKNTNERKEKLSLEQVFLLSDVLPDAENSFLFNIKSIEEVIHDADIVVDTNVLLLPYGAGSSSLAHVVNVYKELCTQQRFHIPAQVAREFVKNRPIKIAELYQGLSDKLSRFIALEKLSYPILEGIDEYADLNTILDEISNLKKKLKQANLALSNKIINWEWNDPVSQAYKTVFTNKIIHEPDFDRTTILTELQKRYDLLIPPGYKDSTKEDMGIGDFLIWKTILEIGKTNQRNLIFVSGEEKADWHHRANNSSFLPRYELRDEYRRESSGKALYIIQLSKLLELLKTEKISIDEIKQEEQRIQDATLVTVQCPFCNDSSEYRLDIANGASALASCSNCNKKFHIHRTLHGIITNKPFSRITTSGNNPIEHISCPTCSNELAHPLGTYNNATSWVTCNLCSSVFPIHRRQDQSVFVSKPKQ